MTASRSTRPLARRTILKALGGAVVATPLLATAGCGGASAAPNTLRVSYQQWGSGRIHGTYLQRAAASFALRHPDVTVELVPLVASENDYFTKNELMMSSERTTSDIVYEDTFILKSDIAAGYLRPIDDRVASWPLWNEFYDVARKAVQGEDGRTYAIPAPTDTRALWYNQELFTQAGIPLPWEPRSWDDLLATFRTLKQQLPDVVPVNIFAGKPQGEKTSMQGVQMLLYGTGSVMYDEATRKWITGSAGLVESLRFIQTLYAEELGPGIADALDANISETIYTSWLPEGKIAVALDGNWINQNWGPGKPGEWPEWAQTMAVAAMPTQSGQDPGVVTLAGGWSWGLPSRARNPELAWQFLTEMCSTEHVLAWTIDDNKVSNRRDVVNHPEYRGYSPTIEFFTGLVPMATYRPALAPYPQISTALQTAADAAMRGAPPEAAVAEYDLAVADIVGGDSTAQEA
ncbi:extracellular solute-binding protein [Pseudonocardia sp. MH-G8]|uniref:extracellular solute-binding protein n=1 Tax=Pseudonocardia sp. MH-G8 TaxID=1854588 RepID=UPI000BA16356|nr:extracellular solute-binding protein [Pseudonocardia sp. MH-G8]OZM78671.1 sugar ABC transporter substrate-binding protein [Pseudonocardia sp. MH-G8]